MIERAQTARSRFAVGSDGSISIHFLSCIGMIVGVSTGSLCCGFAFVYDLAATTFTLVCDV